MNGDLIREQSRVAQQYAKDHVSDCVKDSLEWQKTGIVPDGHLTKLAELCDYAGHAKMGVAESFVKAVAYQKMLELEVNALKVNPLEESIRELKNRLNHDSFNFDSQYLSAGKVPSQIAFDVLSAVERKAKVIEDARCAADSAQPSSAPLPGL